MQTSIGAPRAYDSVDVFNAVEECLKTDRSRTPRYWRFHTYLSVRANGDRDCQGKTTAGPISKLER